MAGGAPEWAVARRQAIGRGSTFVVRRTNPSCKSRRLLLATHPVGKKTKVGATIAASGQMDIPSSSTIPVPIHLHLSAAATHLFLHSHDHGNWAYHSHHQLIALHKSLKFVSNETLHHPSPLPG